ncbi:hypothetical protein Tco_0289865 [Tanacetum coccineum]
MDSLRKNKTWELVDHPTGQKLVSCKWLFKIKERIEVRRISIRVILALIACKDYELEQLDVKTAFYMEILKNSHLGNGIGDDMLIACKSKAEIGSTKSLLKKEFDMKELGAAKEILGTGVILANPGKNHWEAVKWILKYLRGTTNVGLVYGTNRGNHVDVTGFVDSDYAKDPDKGRSITGYAFLVQGCVVSWKATLQHVVALSTTEAEYMALTEAVKEAIWLRGLLEELGVELNTVAVNCDNQGAIHLSRNHVFHERTKHINVRYHFIREVLEAKTVKVLKVGTEHNVADALTKVVYDAKREVDFKSKEDSMKFDIDGHTLELGRIEFSLITGFSVGKIIFPEVKAGDIPPLVRRIFPEKVPGKCKRPKGVSYNVKSHELLDFVKDDEKWKNISDVDAVRVCLLLMAEHAFMGREPNHVMGKPIKMLAENLTARDNFPWAYENVENSENARGKYADLDKGVSLDADAGESSGEETVEENKSSRRESSNLKDCFENDAPHEKVKQELSYAADEVHTMALDEDAKVCTDDLKPSTTSHSFIPADGDQFMSLDEDPKVCIYEEPKPSTLLHSDIPADDVQSIPFDDDAKDTRAEYMNEELRNGSHNKEPLLKQPYVPFRMHTRSKDCQPLDKQPEDKLVHVNAKVDSLLVSLDTAVVDETADKQAKDKAKEADPTQTTPFTQQKRKRRKKRKIGVISPAVIGDDCGEISLTDVTEQQPDTIKPPLVKRHLNRNNGAFNQAVIGDDCKKIPLTAWTEILKRPVGRLSPKGCPYGDSGILAKRWESKV